MHRVNVVTGIRTPKDISTLHDQMPDVHQEFVEVTETTNSIIKICKILSLRLKMESYTYYKLVMVNVRHAAIKIAVDLVDEGVIKKKKRCQMLM